MGIILWLVIGGVVGWLASLVMRRDGSMGIPMNIVVGIIGAMLGGWLIGRRSMIARTAAIIGGLLLFHPAPVADVAGVLAIALAAVLARPGARA